MSDYMRKAFEEVIQDHKKVYPCYVVLWRRSPFYGGPEEGGWWGEDRIPEAYHACQNDEIASKRVEKVNRYAKILTKEARMKHSLHCQQSMDWLEARGLDADYLPEPDGEESFYVSIEPDLPEPSYGSRHWE